MIETISNRCVALLVLNYLEGRSEAKIVIIMGCIRTFS